MSRLSRSDTRFVAQWDQLSSDAIRNCRRVETTDLLVEIKKLRFGDSTGIQCVQPILNADVVVRRSREAGDGIAAERVTLASQNPPRAPVGFVIGL